MVSQENNRTERISFALLSDTAQWLVAADTGNGWNISSDWGSLSGGCSSTAGTRVVCPQCSQALLDQYCQKPLFLTSLLGPVGWASLIRSLYDLGNQAWLEAASTLACLFPVVLCLPASDSVAGQHCDSPCSALYTSCLALVSHYSHLVP